MKNSYGLSLIEVTIVLVIIGLLLGGLLLPLSTRMDQQKIQLTQKRLAEIKEALLGFAIINNRLPCPAKDENGKALDEGDAGCTQEGYLPWKDLGIGRKYDGWNNPFRYRPEDTYTTTIVPVITSGLNVVDFDGKSLTTTSQFRVATIIFSCGKNGIPDNENDATEIQDDIKCSNPGTSNSTYIQNGYIEDQFDDILTWLSKNTLIHRLVAAKKWPP